MGMFLLILAILMPVSVVHCQDALHKFIDFSLSNYKQWVDSNQLDPSPLNSTVAKFNYGQGNINFNMSLWDLVIANHSNHDISSTSGNLLEGRFHMFGYAPRFFISGEYNITGRIMGSVEVSGRGTYGVYATYGLDFRQYGTGLSINPDGFIELSYEQLRDAEAYLPSTEYRTFRFDGLSAGGFEAEVGNVMADGCLMSAFPQFLRYLQQYLIEKFRETPVSDMVGLPTVTPRPITTEEYSTPNGETETPIRTTYDPPYTTAAPRDCDASGSVQGELVVDRKVIRLEDGRDAISITRIVICIV